MAKIQILCVLANASALISGIKFAACEDPPGMLSEPVESEDPAVASMLSIPGYSVHEAGPDSEMLALRARADALGVRYSGRTGADTLAKNIEAAEKAAAEKEAADKAAAEKAEADRLAAEKAAAADAEKKAAEAAAAASAAGQADAKPSPTTETAPPPPPSQPPKTTNKGQVF